MFKSEVMFFSALLRHDPPATCSAEVLPHSVVGVHDESVADSGTVNVRTNGDGLQHWIPVCSGLSSSPSPRPGFVAEAVASCCVYY